METLQLGHATYLFPRPDKCPYFCRSTGRPPREGILDNRNNVAEELGFFGRVVHRRNPRAWLKELKRRLSAPFDDSEASNSL